MNFKSLSRYKTNLLTAPVEDNKIAFSKGGTTTEKVGAVTGDVVLAAGLALSLVDGETTSPIAVGTEEATDEGVDAAITALERQYEDNITHITDTLKNAAEDANKEDKEYYIKLKSKIEQKLESLKGFSKEMKDKDVKVTMDNVLQNVDEDSGKVAQDLKKVIEGMKKRGLEKSRNRLKKS